MIDRIVILGAGGDGAVIAEAIRQMRALGQEITIEGFLDDAMEPGQSFAGKPVLGGCDSWSELSADVRFICAIQKVGDMPRRSARIEQLAIPDERWAAVSHPSSIIASGATIGCGTFIASFVTVQPGAHIGRFVSIRAGANIGHDAIIEDHAYVGPNATLCGRARLERGAHLGPNAVIIDAKTVREFAVVGAGSVVTKTVDTHCMVSGNPARFLRGLKQAPV